MVDHPFPGADDHGGLGRRTDGGGDVSCSRCTWGRPPPVPLLPSSRLTTSRKNAPTPRTPTLSPRLHHPRRAAHSSTTSRVGGRVCSHGRALRQTPSPPYPAHPTPPPNHPLAPRRAPTRKWRVWPHQEVAQAGKRRREICHVEHALQGHFENTDVCEYFCVIHCTLVRALVSILLHLSLK